MKDPNFDIAFSVGGFRIYWYAILLAVGIAAAMLITDRRTKGRAVPKDIALDLCILGVPFGVLGGRLFACLSGMADWSRFFDLSRFGLSFFGGIFLAVLAMLVYLKLRKAPMEEMLDIAAPGVFAGIGIKVWGDFFNRAHYGPLVEKVSHKWFPLATFGDDLRIHYAAFFYEFLLCILLIVLYYALLRKVIRKRGDRFLLMVLGYCLGRFCIDGIRSGMVMVGAIAFDQICEILLAVLCLFLLLLKRKPQQTTEGAEERPADAEEDERTEMTEGSEAPSEPEGDEPPEAPAAAEGPSEPAEPVDADDTEEEEAEPAPEQEPEQTFSGLS